MSLSSLIDDAKRLRSHLVEWVFKIPPPDTLDVDIERDIKVPMADGVVLLADRYFPRGGGKPPTILVRSPYGRSSIVGFVLGRIFAERGFQVLIQSCRGTFGSGGKLDPFHNEQADGLATIAWLKAQDWFSGELATMGPSYLGFVQWAVAREAGPALKAVAAQITASEFRSQTYPGEAFSLSTALAWAHLVHNQEGSPLQKIIGQIRQDRVLASAFKILPLREADRLAVGRRVEFFQEWLEHNEAGDPWWKKSDFSESVAEVTAPVNLLSGWYDIFLPWQLKDYAALQQAGRAPYLTIGPWSHADKPLFGAMVRESLAWFRAHLLGDRSRLRDAPVRIFVMGVDQWREYPAWPPPSQSQRWHLQPGRALAPEPPAVSEPDRYRYDPADPTPAVGGPLLTTESGPRENRDLEARRDVVCYTSAPLERDLTVIGPVRAELYVRSSLEHTDFFARLCDVHPSGQSINICDALVRLAPGRITPEPDGSLRVTLDLWPTAHGFRRGHRLRLQVSSGAHPRFARNTGSGEPLGAATTLIAADQTVYHDPDHPSAVILPVSTH